MKPIPMRETIARALYEDPTETNRKWDALSETRRKPWIADADRVIDAMLPLAENFREFSLALGGVDWLAIGPDELWAEFLNTVKDADLRWWEKQEHDPR